MAKRKRLDVSAGSIPSDLETKSASDGQMRMPIAAVAGDTSSRAALEELSKAIQEAEEHGRLAKMIPITKVAARHLSRDRLAFDEVEMATLMASVKERGQQTPIEVLPLDDGTFGLISGLRRLEALCRLGESDVLAFVRHPESSQSAYQAMVEENEIRANLSFYERAQIAVAASGQGVYSDPRAAIKNLFAHAPKAKRSKIIKFVTICQSIGTDLQFPEAIPEHLGLKLAQALEADGKLADKIGKGLAALAPADAAAERRFLESILRGPVAKPNRSNLATGLQFEGRKGRAVFSGKAVDAAFLADLEEWANARLRQA